MQGAEEAGIFKSLAVNSLLAPEQGICEPGTGNCFGGTGNLSRGSGKISGIGDAAFRRIAQGETSQAQPGGPLALAQALSSAMVIPESRPPASAITLRGALGHRSTMA
jgi:hypothetical protein